MKTKCADADCRLVSAPVYRRITEANPYAIDAALKPSAPILSSTSRTASVKPCIFFEPTDAADTKRFSDRSLTDKVRILERRTELR